MIHKIQLEALRRNSVNRPKGYYEEVIYNGKIQDDTLLIEDEPYVKLWLKYRNHAPALSVPFDKWPMWAKVLAAKSTPEDKGVGDIVARLIGHETSEKFKAFYMVTFSKPCGCNGRQARWNVMYPLNGPQ